MRGQERRERWGGRRFWYAGILIFRLLMGEDYFDGFDGVLIHLFDNQFGFADSEFFTDSGEVADFLENHVRNGFVFFNLSLKGNFGFAEFFDGYTSVDFI